MEKLKKELLKEERKRLRKKSSRASLWIGLALLAVIGSAVWYYKAPERTVGKAFGRAENALAEADFQEAVQAYRRIYQGHPDHPRAVEALFQVAEISNLYLKNYHEALLAYLQLEKDFPAAPWAERSVRQVAAIYKERLKDYRRAIVAYQKLLDRGSEGGDRIQYEIGDAYFRLDNFEQARIEFDALLKTYPESPLVPEVSYRIAVASQLEGSYAEAEKGFRQVIAAWPEGALALEARFGLASVLEERDELRAALEILQELRGSYPNSEALEHRIERVKSRISKKKKAI